MELFSSETSPPYASTNALHTLQEAVLEALRAWQPEVTPDATLHGPHLDVTCSSGVTSFMQAQLLSSAARTDAAGCDGTCTHAQEARADAASARAHLRNAASGTAVLEMQVKELQDERVSAQAAIASLRAELAAQTHTHGGAHDKARPVVRSVEDFDVHGATRKELHALKIAVDAQRQRAEQAAAAAAADLCVCVEELKGARQEQVATLAQCQQVARSLAQQEEERMLLRAQLEAAQRDATASQAACVSITHTCEKAVHEAACSAAKLAAAERTLEDLRAQLESFEGTVLRKTELLQRANESMLLQETALTRLRGEVLGMRARVEVRKPLGKELCCRMRDACMRSGAVQASDRVVAEAKAECVRVSQAERAHAAETAVQLQDAQAQVLALRASLQSATDECARLEGELQLCRGERACMRVCVLDLERQLASRESVAAPVAEPADRALPSTPPAAPPSDVDAALLRVVHSAVDHALMCTDGPALGAMAEGDAVVPERLAQGSGNDFGVPDQANAASP